MSAGYMQLAALGQQDVYLTGEPQVTYFSGVYRRHTPFVLEAYDIPFLGQTVKFGSKSICRIPPKGDLIRGMTLAMTLPQLSNAQIGQNWYWPIPPNASNAAQFVINSYTNTANIGPVSGITWYSTYNATASGTDQWLNQPGTNGPLSKWVTYSNVSNKFTFSNVGGGSLTSIWVKGSSPTLPFTNSGIFWGLDPYQASVISGPWYGYTVTNNTFTAHLTLEQSGWLINPTPGLPPAASRTGLVLQSPSSGVTIGTGLTQLDFNHWSTWDATPSSFGTTPNGKIKVVAQGLYIVKLGLGASSGYYLSNVAWGVATNDAQLGTAPDFLGSYEWRVSPNPASPVVFPVDIKYPNSNIYVCVTGTGGTLSQNSYVTVNLVDDYFLLTSNLAITGSPYKVPFVGNVYSTGSTTTLKATDGSLTWQMTSLGTFLVTGIVSLSNGYVTTATLAEGANTVYTYDMSSQGRDPTFVFSMPLIVTDTNRNYFMNLVCTDTLANVQAGTFFTFQQVGIPATSTTGTQGVLPWAGLTFQPQSNTIVSTADVFTNPLQIASENYVSNGYQYIETISGTSNLQFSNAGTYVLTGALCTADTVKSMTINTWSSTGNTSTTYNFSLGLLPPYTVNMPFRIADPTSSNTSIYVTLNGSTTRPNIFSNTFLSVYPLAGQSTVITQFSYYDSVGTLSIASAELKIGGQSIQTLTGESIELWNDLNVSYENQPALTVLTGKGDVSNSISTRTYYVNLPFYFYGHPELSIPIVALDRQDIEVHVTFNNFSNLTSITTAQNPALLNPPLYATIITEYVYLSQPEINWFKTARIDQVITQWQYQTYHLPVNSTGGVFPLPFINPVRELFFVLQPEGNAPYDYSENGLISLGLSFNGYEAFTTTTTDATYMGVIEPYNHYPTFPTRQFYMYSFCTDAGSLKPSGFVNFSRIRQVLLTLNTTPLDTAGKSFRIVAVNHNILRIENGLAGLMFNST